MEAAGPGRTCEWCKGTEKLLGFAFKRCSQCLTAYYCCVDCQTKDWELRHSKECRKFHMLAPRTTPPSLPRLPIPSTSVPTPPAPLPIASPSHPTPVPSSSILSPSDLRCLARGMSLSESWLAKCLENETSITNLKASDLRMILTYLRDNCNRKNVKCWGNKVDLARSVMKELYGGGQALPRQPQLPPAKRRKVGSDSNDGPVSVPGARGGGDITQDPVFLSRQNPYYRVQQSLASIHFGSSARVYTHRHVYKQMFSLDASTFNEVQEGRRQRKRTLSVHIRMISLNDKKDIGWDHSYNLTCNYMKVDTSRNEKKIRQLKMLTPFITPHPADITPYIQQANNNIIEFSIPRDLSGVAVIQLVREATTDQLLDAIQRQAAEITKAKNSAKGASDLEETGVIVSLRCPLSYCKIESPAKGINCNHLQCFDAKSFLEYCNQQLLWHCPVCNKPLPYGELLVDEYFEQMLRAIDTEELKVMVLPDGTFSLPGKTVAAVVKREPAATKKRKAKEIVEICLDDSDGEGGGGSNTTSTSVSNPPAMSRDKGRSDDEPELDPDDDEEEGEFDEDVSEEEGEEGEDGVEKVGGGLGALRSNTFGSHGGFQRMPLAGNGDAADPFVLD